MFTPIARRAALYATAFRFNSPADLVQVSGLFRVVRVFRGSSPVFPLQLSNVSTCFRSQVSCSRISRLKSFCVFCAFLRPKNCFQLSLVRCLAFDVECSRFRFQVSRSRVSRFITGLSTLTLQLSNVSTCFKSLVSGLSSQLFLLSFGDELLKLQQPQVDAVQDQAQAE